MVSEFLIAAMGPAVSFLLPTATPVTEAALSRVSNNAMLLSPTHFQQSLSDFTPQCYSAVSWIFLFIKLPPPLASVALHSPSFPPFSGGFFFLSLLCRFFLIY